MIQFLAPFPVLVRKKGFHFTSLNLTTHHPLPSTVQERLQLCRARFLRGLQWRYFPNYVCYSISGNV